MTKSDLKHLLNAIDSAALEFEELMREKEWYVTDVTELLYSSRRIVLDALEENHQ